MPGIRIKKQQKTGSTVDSNIGLSDKDGPVENKYYLFQELKNDFSRKYATEISRQLLFHDIFVNPLVRLRFLQRYSISLPDILDFNYTGTYSDGAGETAGPLILSDVIDELGSVEKDDQGRNYFVFHLNEKYPCLYFYDFKEILRDYEEKLQLRFSSSLKRGFKNHKIFLVPDDEHGGLKYDFSRGLFFRNIKTTDKAVLDSLVELINKEIKSVGYSNYDDMMSFIEKEVEKNSSVADDLLRYAMAHFTSDGYIRFTSDGKKVRYNRDEIVTGEEFMNFERFPEPLLRIQTTIE